MASRHKAREYALQMLYQAETAGVPMEDAKPAEQRSLAHARLAADKHKAADLARLLQPLAKLGQARRALQQVRLGSRAHGAIILHRGDTVFKPRGACRDSLPGVFTHGPHAVMGRFATGRCGVGIRSEQ